jgi:hypothetical protein
LLSTISIWPIPSYLSAVTPSVSGPFPLFLSAVHPQYLARSFVPQCGPPSVSGPFPSFLSTVLRQCMAYSFVSLCCPPSVYGPFLRASVLSSVSVWPILSCLSAVLRQCMAHSFAPQCCPPSMSGPFPSFLSAVLCQCMAYTFVPQCYPPSVYSPFLCSSVLSTISAWPLVAVQIARIHRLAIVLKAGTDRCWHCSLAAFNHYRHCSLPALLVVGIAHCQHKVFDPVFVARICPIAYSTRCRHCLLSLLLRDSLKCSTLYLLPESVPWCIVLTPGIASFPRCLLSALLVASIKCSTLYDYLSLHSPVPFAMSGGGYRRVSCGM